MLSLPPIFQGWTKKAEWIQCPAPLPEHPEKKAKKKGKEARSGLCRKGTSDIASEDTEALSSHDEDEEEVEENNSPLMGERRKGELPQI